jgi:hypothetical protein
MFFSLVGGSLKMCITDIFVKQNKYPNVFFACFEQSKNVYKWYVFETEETARLRRAKINQPTLHHFAIFCGG